jgi:hypothetical protein
MWPHVITYCYSLDLECSWKFYVLKIWSPGVHLGGGSTFERWYLEEGPHSGHWVIDPKSSVLPYFPFNTPTPPHPCVCAPMFTLPSHKMSGFTSPHSCQDVLYCYSPKMMGPIDHRLETLKPWDKITFFYLQVNCLRFFVTVWKADQIIFPLVLIKIFTKNTEILW